MVNHSIFFTSRNLEIKDILKPYLSYGMTGIIENVNKLCVEDVFLKSELSSVLYRREMRFFHCLYNFWEIDIYSNSNVIASTGDR